MNSGKLILSSGAFLLLLFSANMTMAEGNYQRSDDGKTLVWNNSPNPEDQAGWSGRRGADNYAKGNGTLTWYRLGRKMVTGSSIPAPERIVISRYTGTMVQGKLEGAVTVEMNEKVLHATFSDGSRISSWVPGRASGSESKRLESPSPETVAEASPARPTPAVGRTERPKKKVAEVAAVETSPPADDSLRSLTGPPSSLNVEAVAEVAPSPTPASTPVKSSSPPPHPKASTADDARAVAALDTQYQAAVKANDAATMERILADDFVLVTGRGRTSTKADLIKEARGKKAIYEHQEEEEGTQKVRVWGDTAVVTALLWIKGTEEGIPLDYKVWFSDTYVRTPAGWRYAFGQASTPLAKPNAK